MGRWEQETARQTLIPGQHLQPTIYFGESLREYLLLKTKDIRPLKGLLQPNFSIKSVQEAKRYTQTLLEIRDSPNIGKWDGKGVRNLVWKIKPNSDSLTLFHTRVELLERWWTAAFCSQRGSANRAWASRTAGRVEVEEELWYLTAVKGRCRLLWESPSFKALNQVSDGLTQCSGAHPITVSQSATLQLLVKTFCMLQIYTIMWVWIIKGWRIFFFFFKNFSSFYIPTPVPPPSLLTSPSTPQRCQHIGGDFLFDSTQVLKRTERKRKFSS